MTVIKERMKVRHCEMCFQNKEPINYIKISATEKSCYGFVVFCICDKCLKELVEKLSSQPKE